MSLQLSDDSLLIGITEPDFLGFTPEIPPRLRLRRLALVLRSVYRFDAILGSLDPLPQLFGSDIAEKIYYFI